MPPMYTRGQPTLTHDEHGFVRSTVQVLQCLRGVVTDGPALQRSAVGGHPQLEPVPCVYTQQMSVGALGAVLEHFAEAASASIRYKHPTMWIVCTKWSNHTLVPQPANGLHDRRGSVPSQQRRLHLQGAGRCEDCDGATLGSGRREASTQVNCRRRSRNAAAAARAGRLAAGAAQPQVLCMCMFRAKFVNADNIPSTVHSGATRPSASMARSGRFIYQCAAFRICDCCRCEGRSSTLLWLDAEVRGVTARLQLLDAVGLVAAAAAAAVATDTTGGAGAAASAQLVDGLQALLGPRLLQGGPQGDHSRGSR